MTSFEIEEFVLTRRELDAWSSGDPRFRNWPVVYLLDNRAEIYVGESLNTAARIRQHLESPGKQSLRAARVIIDPTFNKSVCLDLESYLIRLFAGDGKYQVLNRNDGVTNADYYRRADYQETFDEVFDALRERGAFMRPIRDIENSDLFKLSPFKALSQDQAIAVEDILEGLFDDISGRRDSRIVIQGDPGTGKTVVAVYLMKLLQDIKHADLTEPSDGESVLSEFFVEGYPELLRDFRIGLVIPQQSLRKSIENVFKKTPGLDPAMVLTPYEVGRDAGRFSLLIVDETHRLNQRSNQPSGPMNARFRTINEQLFGEDDLSKTQLDWVIAKSDHQIFLLDSAQSVRPHDVSEQTLAALLPREDEQRRRYRLASQMRVQGGADYVTYIRNVLADSSPPPQPFDGYDLRMYDDLSEMYDAILERDAEVGLARLVAGYAWQWRSRRDKNAYDIVLDGLRLRWNVADIDWINSPGSINEVGSIHTIQGYDLNYAGVIIGRDLRYDRQARQIVFDRNHYFDKKGMENNRARGITYTDEDILRFVRNIYRVLLTRGMLGTYVYVCDPDLREHLRPYLAQQPSTT
ncbi:hypothetical protein GCM10011519_07290 [Marmoricola endophyticus]|uniref:GIY-YIG domain-containing protein n=1 Tax=Marmoricola endophyticus TaxID=2040280 RepID=A0A917BCD0_9ACTN|nr:DUF2075 domain-containing protein [Marmoricola endophyticus]GGF36328.1 hypothetical protein GCM10011519_07290 [Marmoricola endophyticus]